MDELSCCVQQAVPVCDTPCRRYTPVLLLLVLVFGGGGGSTRARATPLRRGAVGSPLFGYHSNQEYQQGIILHVLLILLLHDLAVGRKPNAKLSFPSPTAPQQQRCPPCLLLCACVVLLAVVRKGNTTVVVR